MRIENSNNVVFGAYFKKNALFKHLFAETQITPEFINNAQLFANKLPNHELEILSLNSEHPFHCHVFNNTTNKMLDIYLSDSQCERKIGLKNIISDITTDFVFGSFFKIDKTTNDTFEKLTNHDR